MSHHYTGYDYQQQPAYALPAAPAKAPRRAPQQTHAQHHDYAASPHAPRSLGSSSYAGSAEGDGDVDMVELLTQRLQGAFDPPMLDRGLVVQAQTSGMLNSKTRELAELQEEAVRKMEETRRAFADGMKVAKEVRSDLETVHRKVRVLKQKTERKYPVEYNMAREQIPPSMQ